jgi:Uma2 family endonuclease
LNEDSEPEPDIVLLPPGGLGQELVSKTLLIIEVAVSSLARDKGVKAEMYAAAMQPEYWVVDVKGRRVIVHRDPQNGSYATLRTYADNESVAPLAFPDLALAVSDILPRPSAMASGSEPESMTLTFQRG